MTRPCKTLLELRHEFCTHRHELLKSHVFGRRLSLVLLGLVFLHVLIFLCLLLSIDLGNKALVWVVEEVYSSLLEYPVEIVLQTVVQRLRSDIQKRIST